MELIKVIWISKTLISGTIFLLYLISSISHLCHHVWLANILISSFLPQTAEAVFVCPWQFTVGQRWPALWGRPSISLCSWAFIITRQDTGPLLTLSISLPAGFFWAQVFFTKPPQKPNCQMLHIFDRRVYIRSKLNGPYRGLNVESIPLNLCCCTGTPEKPHLSSCALLTHSDQTLYVNCWPY